MSKIRRGRPLLADVARSAGVSPMTASRALRGETTVALQAREAVEAAAARLGYVPNQLAGSLRSQRSGIIAVIVPTLTGSVFAETVKGIADTFDALDYQLMIGESSYDIEREEKVIAALSQRRPDGVIIAGVNHTRRARDILLNANVPVAEIWSQTTHPVDNVVGFSNKSAAYDMTAALIGKGYRAFALATGPVIPGNRAGERAAGHHAALVDHGLARGPSLVAPYDQFLENLLHGGERVVDFIAKNPAVDCLFCTNELIAIGTVVAASRRGMRVPQDIAITGFGDVEAASIITPALTTLKIRGREMGRRAAEILARRLTGETTESEIVDVGYEIVWRSSA